MPDDVSNTVMVRVPSKIKKGKDASAGQRRRSARLTLMQRTRAEQEDIDATTIAHEDEPRGQIRMHFATTISPRLVVNRPIAVPVVVLFNHSSGTSMMTEVEDVWMFASLVDNISDEETGTSLLVGQRADSAHPLPAATHPDGSFAYASFPDLAVSKPGRYKLRLTAIDMRMAEERQVSQEPGRVLPAALLSDAFDVVNENGSVRADEPEEGAMLRLKQLGLDR